MGAFEEYAAALAAFKAANAEVDKLAVEISAVGKQLVDNRGAFCFSNVPGGFPLEVTGSPHSRSANGSDWKSAAQINEALIGWHSARSNLNDLWRSLPADQREALQPPPTAAVTPPWNRR